MNDWNFLNCQRNQTIITRNPKAIEGKEKVARVI